MLEIPGKVSPTADAWYSEPTKTALSIAYFGAPLIPSSGGLVKVWNGTAWVEKPIKVWNGTAWVQKPLKRWNGTAWV